MTDDKHYSVADLPRRAPKDTQAVREKGRAGKIKGPPV